MRTPTPRRVGSDMALRIELKPGPYTLSDIWCTKEQFAGMGEDAALKWLREEWLDVVVELLEQHPDLIWRVSWSKEDGNE